MIIILILNFEWSNKCIDFTIVCCCFFVYFKVKILQISTLGLVLCSELGLVATFKRLKVKYFQNNQKKYYKR